MYIYMYAIPQASHTTPQPYDHPTIHPSIQPTDLKPKKQPGLGFYHVGFVKALFDQGILPRVLSGASAGSIISSMIGVRTDDELYSMFTDGIARLDFFKLYKRRK